MPITVELVVTACNGCIYKMTEAVQRVQKKCLVLLYPLHEVRKRMPPARLEKSSTKAHRAAFSHISCIKPKQLIVATASISGTLTSDVSNAASAYSGQETTCQLSNCDAALRHVDR